MRKHILFTVSCLTVLFTGASLADTIQSHTGFEIEKICIKSVHYHAADPKSRVAMFGDTVIITVSNSEEIERKRSMKNPIVLYINRNPFGHINGHLAGSQNNEIKFILNRYSEENDNWDQVLRSGFITKGIYLGVGLQDGSLVTPVSYPILFTLRTPAETIPFISVCVIIIGFTIYLVWKRKLLMEKNGEYYVYSLSSMHLFFWTLIILLSYMLIWFVCDDMNSIDPSTLILLGISAGTASASGIINGSKENAGKLKARPSRGILNDILCAEEDISMNRYQIVVFNLVIGAFFIYKTVGELKMPVLNETVLALLGISSATYATIKAISAKAASGNPKHEEEIKKEPS
ncbi:MAG: hypothetical protein ACHQRM_08260 [Bacteroidia bacterium]